MSNVSSNQWDTLLQSQKSKSEIDNKDKFKENIQSYFFIFDCFDNTILYVNNAFETITGYPTDSFNVEKLISIIHPEDVSRFFASEERGLHFTNKLLFHEHFKYILSYSYRIKTEEGKYIRILQQCQAIEVNDSGHLTKTFVIHKRIEDTEDRQKKDYRILDKSQNIYIDEQNSYNLTQRELEILNLIKEGLNSVQIANRLNISKNTVITHRKNILTKANASSFIEIIKRLSISSFE